MKNTKVELNDTELENVNGGMMFIVFAQKMPEKRPDEKYVMNAAPTVDEIIGELKS